MAAEVMQRQPAAIQLRYLQTLVEIGSEKNTTVVFPLPVDTISSLGRVLLSLADADRSTLPERHSDTTDSTEPGDLAGDSGHPPGG